jgi:uncharacterized protein YifE (UPF0438 family)
MICEKKSQEKWIVKERSNIRYDDKVWTKYSTFLEQSKETDDLNGFSQT